ncbi:MAG: DUF2255 family protein [Bryobacteraceae bacterium]
MRGKKIMSGWAKEDLDSIAESDDLHISPFREDGRTYGTPTWIWSVVVDSNVYVRSYNGPAGRWYQAAIQQKAGRITTAGIMKEVAFHPVDGTIQDRIDDAYRAKYKGSPYLSPMINARARAATVKWFPVLRTQERRPANASRNREAMARKIGTAEKATG